MFIYSQCTGYLWGNSGLKLSEGYSGHNEGLNDPRLEAIKNVGPIPRGLWIISGCYDSGKVGPFALKLEPSEHNALGRTYFRIHGDNRHLNQSASHGCIILPRAVRNLIWSSNDKLLKVIE